MTTPSVRRLIASEYAWIGTAFIVLVAVAYLVLNSTTTGTFDKLERQNIAGQGARIASSLGYERSLISNLTSTNSEWDSLYDAVRLRQADGVGSLLPAAQMSGNFGLSAMVTLDRTGRVVSGGPIAAGGSHYLPVPASLDVSLITPSGFLGGAREAMVWEKDNIRRWVEMGIRDGEEFLKKNSGQAVSARDLSSSGPLY